MNQNFSNITDKYPCKKCGQRMMSPNIIFGLIKRQGTVKGHKCAYCGTVNYPVRDSLETK